MLPKLTVRVILYICTAATFLSGLTAYWSLQGPLEYTVEHDVPSPHARVTVDLSKPPSHPHHSSSPGKAKASSSTVSSAKPPKATTAYKHLLPEHLVGSEDVHLIIKTGATELFEKLPVHFVTTLTHVPQYTIYSDIDQKLGDYVIYDSLIEYNQTVVETNPDFKLYMALKNDKPLRQDPKRLKYQGGWELDKYKNIYTLSKTFEMRPDAKWYLFIDADTYVMWPNLLRWLKGKDHTKQLYYGSPAMFKEITFGHGGTGYLVSNGAMRHVVGNNPNVAKNYEDEAANSCCGDHVLAKLMLDHGIELTRATPSFNGEPQYTVKFDDEKWCQPVVTFHHMYPSDIEDMWEFEREKAEPNKDILFIDVYNHFVAPQLVPERDSWDNYSDDEKWINENKRDNGTWAECKSICEEDESCLQFSFKKDSCKTMNGVKSGWRLIDDTLKSGWMLDRIKRFADKSCPR